MTPQWAIWCVVQVKMLIQYININILAKCRIHDLMSCLIARFTPFIIDLWIMDAVLGHLGLK